MHYRSLAHILGRASAWAYSDIDTYANMMYCLGIANEFVAVTTTNPSLLVNTTAYISQSADKRLAILCFRGTELQNFVTWMTDASARADLLFSAGHVHGGFLRAVMSVWTAVEALLYSAHVGYSICDAGSQLKNRYQHCVGEIRQCGRYVQRRDSEKYQDNSDHIPPALALKNEHRLKALYIAGHSQGGAMAVLAAAILHLDPELDDLRQKLRGVYTFGQPMVGHRDFAASCSKQFGNKLFRHVYGNDIVPRQPPLTTGRFMHFGEEYGSSEEGWEPRAKSASQAWTFVGSSIVGLLAWATQNLKGIPFPSWLHMPFSWSDHEPINYLRTSQLVGPGAEFL
ncbi:lipase family protein [Sorangium sp. So ce124]|uniref:lipase family protein n=1 Tax=Sorangium sp. So ce124 TaxID=3133280 RepID=UPI003F63A524